MTEKNENSIPPAVDSASDDLNNLNELEKAAFEKIMAEIGASMGEPPGAVEEEPIDATPDQVDANPDQSEKVENADTNTNAETVQEDQTQEDHAQSEEELNAEQQAVLEQIMGEINSKSTTVDKDTADNADAAPEPLAASPSPADESSFESTAPEQPDEGLSLEDFDAELANLLEDPYAAAETAEPESAEVSDPSLQPLQSTSVEDPAAKTSLALEPDQQDLLEKSSTAESETAQLTPVSETTERVENSPPVKSASPAAESAPIKKVNSRHRFKAVHAAVLLAVVVAVAIGGYFGRTVYQSRFNPQTIKTAVPATVDAAGAAVAAKKALPADRQSSAYKAEAPTRRPDAFEPLTVLQRRIADVRRQVQIKTDEIEQLVQYYESGINSDLTKIEVFLAGGEPPDFAAVIADKKLELQLKSVQRRKLYQSRLERPLQQLAVFSEQLLYHDRIIGLYQLFSSNLTSLPLTETQQKVETVLATYQDYIAQLAIDEIEVAPPSLESLWQQMRQDLKTKQERSAQLGPLNRAIGAEICRGDFRRAGQLTALTDEAARCLSQCKEKDLYLNGLRDLPPETARTLSQWPGESLGLNGLTTITTETARQLALWPGKRLSLNGLTELSPEATRQLARWQGAHLEMIGLKSIGAWQNYSTRLYLSEQLRQLLEQ